MKIDGLGVVLAIILLPILLVVTFYIQMQVDTIAKENLYNSQLLSATYDAMAAFEINTANEQLSSVADSMRSIILASNNVFLNSLATNLGISNASKEHLQPYIPAVLYTMYDGYYIYSPTETAKVAEKTEDIKDSEGVSTGLQKTDGYRYFGQNGEYDSQIDGSEKAIYGDIIYEKKGGGYTTKKDKADTETDYILKSYVQYSARYAYPKPENPTIDVIINYTLDNYLNIVGRIDGVYYTKTGYLIKNGLVSDITIDGKLIKSGNEEDIKNRILGLKSNAATSIEAADSASVTVNGVTIESNFKNIRDIGNIARSEASYG